MYSENTKIVEFQVLFIEPLECMHVFNLLHGGVCYNYCYTKLIGVHCMIVKKYDIQYRMCASVIRSLCSCSCLDRDYELMIKTLACD